jgi:hypothetical protein
MRSDHPGDSSDEVHDGVAPPGQQQTANADLLVARQHRSGNWGAGEQVEESPTRSRCAFVDRALKEGEERRPVPPTIVIAPNRGAPRHPLLNVVGPVKESGYRADDEREPNTTNDLQLARRKRCNQFACVCVDPVLVRGERPLGEKRHKEGAQRGVQWWVGLEWELSIRAHIFVTLMERRVPFEISPRRADRLIAGNAR